MNVSLESVIKDIASDKEKNDKVTNLIMMYIRTRPRNKEGDGVDTALTKNYFHFLYATFCITKAYLINNSIRHSINLINETTQMQYEQVFSDSLESKNTDLIKKNIPEDLVAEINHFALENSDKVPDPHFAYFFMINSYHLLTGFKYISFDKIKKIRNFESAFI
ncbi:MAG: hypothetical protein JW791_05285 [Nanoarchaeota archaeon]|nr:hypothetical protein [Nanoarchaeota archaeon]